MALDNEAAEKRAGMEPGKSLKSLTELGLDAEYLALLMQGAPECPIFESTAEFCQHMVNLGVSLSEFSMISAGWLMGVAAKLK